MAKTITTSEDSHHEISAAGTIVGSILMSDTIATAVDSVTGGGETKDYNLSVDGIETTYSTEEERDKAARDAV